MEILGLQPVAFTDDNRRAYNQPELVIFLLLPAKSTAVGRGRRLLLQGGVVVSAVVKDFSGPAAACAAQANQV
jgi:hypothetical protein